MPSAPTREFRPRTLSLVAQLPGFARDPLGFLRSVSARADVATIRMGPKQVYAVCHPDLVHTVLADGRRFDKGGHIYEKARQVVGNGLVTCPHDSHRRQRRLVQPVFGRERIERYSAVMTEEIEATSGAWRDGAVVDAAIDAHHLAARVTSRTLFTARFDPTVVDDIMHAAEVIEKGMFRRVLLPSRPGEGLPGTSARTFHKVQTRLDEIVAAVIADYRGGDTDSGTDHGDMLSVLLSARDDTSTPHALTDQELRDQVLTMLLSGIETSAVTIAWALHLLSIRPDLADQLRAEAALDGRAAGWDDLPRLDGFRRVLSETLRLYPPVWLATRTTVGDTELGGVTIPDGSTLLLSPVFTHYRPEIYADPGRFDPDRWTAERASAYPRGSFVPFGGGARKCIGEQFGMVEATLAVATMVDRWRFAPAGRTPVRVARRIVLSPRAVPLRLAVR